MHHRAKDLTGQTVGYLTALKYQGSDGRRSLWAVRCNACGSQISMQASEFMKQQRRGVTASCGCMRKQTIGAKNSTHAMSKHPAYWVWRSMVDRCTLPSHQAWPNYGGRGITVCARWRASFKAFWSDMGDSYRKGLTIERVHNDKGYSPTNCAWATHKAQANNTRRTVFVQTKWGKVTLTKLSELSGIGRSTLAYRLSQGVKGEALLEKPDVSRKFST